MKEGLVFTVRSLRKRYCWQKRPLLGLIGLVTYVVLPIVACAQTARATPQETVGRFCAFEFRGAQDVEERLKLVHFSDERVRELGKIMDGLSPYVFEWETEPLEVVDSYKVDQITISGEQANAIVTYELVAERSSWGGNIQPVSKTDITTQLQLEQYGNRWKVNDPPFPRVSKKFLTASYRGIFDLPPSWYQNASSAQLLRLRNAIDTILLIDKLK